MLSQGAQHSMSVMLALICASFGEFSVVVLCLQTISTPLQYTSFYLIRTNTQHKDTSNVQVLAALAPHSSLLDLAGDPSIWGAKNSTLAELRDAIDEVQIFVFDNPEEEGILENRLCQVASIRNLLEETVHPPPDGEVASDFAAEVSFYQNLTVRYVDSMSYPMTIMKSLLRGEGPSLTDIPLEVLLEWFDQFHRWVPRRGISWTVPFAQSVSEVRHTFTSAGTPEGSLSPADGRLLEVTGDDIGSACLTILPHAAT